MEIAFIADIHSNMEALKAVLAEIGAKKMQKVYCLGDLVGYGPDPNRVVEAIKSRNIPCIMGNHDWAVMTGETKWFNQYAAEAINWNRKKTSEANRAFLASLKETLVLKKGGKRILLVHGSPKRPLFDYVYPERSKRELESFFAEEEVDIICVGHSHVPFVYEKDGKVFINAGSVGQPRDGDKRASYAVLDTKTWKAEICRVAYDSTPTKEKIFKAGLPKFLGERLALGL